jgi:hypothetical protein
MYHMEEVQKLKTASGQFAEVKQLEEKLAQQKVRTDAARATADVSASATIELQRTLTDKLTKLAESQQAAEEVSTGAPKPRTAMLL